MKVRKGDITQQHIFSQVMEWQVISPFYDFWSVAINIMDKLQLFYIYL